MGIIDTHSHLWVDRLGGRLPALLEEARQAGVENILLCAGGPTNWERTEAVAHRFGLGYLLGVHPLALNEVTPTTMKDLRARCEARLSDPFFIGIGEVGLDGFVPGIDQKLAEAVLLDELKISRDLALPLSLHARRSVSRLLGLMHRVAPAGGVVHAFNGSDVERDAFLKLGLKLGFGGAATQAGSLRIRRHLAELPDGDWVLETDAPDMPGAKRREGYAQGRSELLTEPADIEETVATAAALRGVSEKTVVAASRAAAIEAFPRLKDMLLRTDAFANR